MIKIFNIVLCLFFMLIGIQIFAQSEFTINPKHSCDSATVSFINNNPSNAYLPLPMQTTGYSYDWDFGNGTNSNNENPNPVLYQTAGEYIVNYNVTIDTTGYYLEEVHVNAVGCNDPFGGNVDLYLIIVDGSDNEVFNNISEYDSYQTDPDAPDVTFTLNPPILLNNPPYYLKVMDDDSGDSNDNCLNDDETSTAGAFFMLPTNDTTGFGVTIQSNTVQELGFILTFNKPVTTKTDQDTVYIHSKPIAPVITPANSNYCSADNMTDLQATGTNVVWYSDAALTNVISNGNTLIIPDSTDGTHIYYATAEDTNYGCKSNPAVAIVTIGQINGPVVNNNPAIFCQGEVFSNISAIGNNIVWYSDSLLTDTICSGNNLTVQESDTGIYTYYAVQEDSTGTCTSTATEVIVEILPGIDADITITDASCHNIADGMAMINITQGEAPYTISWSTGENTETASNLIAGEYVVTVFDNNFCLNTFSAIVSSPPAMQLFISKMDIICNGDANGQISAFVSGSQAPYTYQWSNGESGSSIVNLEAGDYSVIVTDNYTCTDTAFASIIEPTEIIAIKDIMPVSCGNRTDGSITINVQGGVPPYSYYWSNGNTDSTQNNLAAGIYAIQVTDANTCTHHYSAQIKKTYERCLVPASVLTPNSDGANDTWKILYIEDYPEAVVQVFTKNGLMVYEQPSGYNQEWNGEYNGKKLPIGSYFYVINLQDGSEPLTGVVDILY